MTGPDDRSHMNRPATVLFNVVTYPLEAQLTLRAGQQPARQTDRQTLSGALMVVGIEWGAQGRKPRVSKSKTRCGYQFRQGLLSV